MIMPTNTSTKGHDNSRLSSHHRGYNDDTSNSSQRRSSKMGNLSYIMFSTSNLDTTTYNSSKHTKKHNNNHNDFTLPKIHETPNKKNNKNSNNNEPKHYMTPPWQYTSKFDKKETKAIRNSHEKHLLKDKETLYQYLQPNTCSLTAFESTMHRGGKRMYHNKRKSKNKYRSKSDDSEIEKNNINNGHHAAAAKQSTKIVNVPLLAPLASHTKSTKKYNRMLRKDHQRKLELLSTSAKTILDPKGDSDEYVRNVCKQIKRDMGKKWNVAVSKYGGSKNEYEINKLQKNRMIRKKKMKFLDQFSNFQRLASTAAMPAENVHLLNILTSQEHLDKYFKMYENRLSNKQITYDGVAQWVTMEKCFRAWKKVVDEKRQELTLLKWRGKQIKGSIDTNTLKNTQDYNDHSVNLYGSRSSDMNAANTDES